MVTKEMIKNSMEAKWCKRDLKFLLIGFAISMFVSFGSLANDKIPAVVFLVSLLLCVLLFGGLILYGWVSYLLLLSRREEYEIHAVVLEYQSVSYLRKGYVYFTVPITTKDGDTVYCKTSPMWSDYLGSMYKTWDYYHETVKVAYSEERNDLIVLGKAGFEEDDDERNK